MTVTVTGLAARALVDVRSALSRCATIQALMGQSGIGAAAATLALIFYADAGDELPARYILLTCRPTGARPVADSTRVYGFEISAEVWGPTPSAAATPGEDFLHGHNLSEAEAELWEQHEAQALLFDLVGTATDTVVRDDDVGAGAGDVGNVLTVSLEAWG